MCLRFVFLLITRMSSWLRLSWREKAWKTAEILLLRHQLAVLQRQQPRRPSLDWADRALLATLLSVIPKARRHGAARSKRAGPAGQPPAGTSKPWCSGLPARTPAGVTAVMPSAGLCRVAGLRSGFAQFRDDEDR